MEVVLPPRVDFADLAGRPIIHRLLNRGQLLAHHTARESWAAFEKEEMAIAAKILMIAITISISIKVKAFRVRFISGRLN